MSEEPDGSRARGAAEAAGAPAPAEPAESAAPRLAAAPAAGPAAPATPATEGEPAADAEAASEPEASAATEPAAEPESSAAAEPAAEPAAARGPTLEAAPPVAALTENATPLPAELPGRGVAEARATASPMTRVSWLLQLARHLRGRHEDGRVHGRVGLDALRLDGAGRLFILEPDQLPPRRPGADAYQAPESFDGSPPGPHVDLYGWGAVAFDLLEGRPPHDAAARAALVRGQACAPEDAPAARVLAGPDLELLLLECLLWEPDDRPTGMDEVETRLVRVLQLLRRRHQRIRAETPGTLGLWKALATLAFVPLVYLGFEGLSAYQRARPLRLEVDYGEVVVRAAEVGAPAEARFRLKAGDKTIGVRRAAAGGDIRFPVEAGGDLRVELVDGDRVLASQPVPPLPPLPGLRVKSAGDSLEVMLARGAARQLELRLEGDDGPGRKIPLLRGQKRLRIAWRGDPGAYSVELRDPQTGRVIERHTGVTPAATAPRR